MIFNGWVDKQVVELCVKSEKYMDESEMNTAGWKKPKLPWCQVYDILEKAKLWRQQRD